MHNQKLTTKETSEEILQESRMILPGIQALFGFQLIAFFNTAFPNLTRPEKSIHLLAVALTIIAIGLLMAPVAYHRQVERDSVSPFFVKYASALLTFGMFPLAASIALDSYVVWILGTNNQLYSTYGAAASFIYLITMWYVIPQYAKGLRNNTDKS